MVDREVQSGVAQSVPIHLKSVADNFFPFILKQFDLPGSYGKCRQ